LHNLSESTYQIALKPWDYVENKSVIDFIHSPKFDFNKWVYIGVSFSLEDRLGDKYDIHMVSKTYSGIENQDSFLSQNFQFKCDLEIQNSYFDHNSVFIFTVGSILKDEMIKFTGMIGSHLLV